MKTTNAFAFPYQSSTIAEQVFNIEASAFQKLSLKLAPIVWRAL